MVGIFFFSGPDHVVEHRGTYDSLQNRLELGNGAHRVTIAHFLLPGATAIL